MFGTEFYTVFIDTVIAITRLADYLTFYGILEDANCDRIILNFQFIYFNLKNVLG